MINGDKKISLSKVDLKEYLKFYKTEICSFSYKYTLEDNTEIILSFKEENFSHLLGLHKFKKINSYKVSLNINNDIIENKIILKDLISKEKNILTPELKDRIVYFPLLKKLLYNTDTALKYDLNVIWNSKIEFSFLLKTERISVIVYLAVKKISETKKVCIPVSLLVDRNNRFSKMKLKELKIIGRNIEKK
ncbi:MAG: hypothetical protein KHZ27_07725 [Fusobacterium sp.]|nr:hypothetical protein [Fusobacterium sp.]